jgi:hypothetical protein
MLTLPHIRTTQRTANNFEQKVASARQKKMETLHLNEE